MLSDIKDIIFIGVPVGILVYFYAQQQFQYNGCLKKIMQIPWVCVLGKPGFWKKEYIIYVQDGCLVYEFASYGSTAAQKLGRGTWYVWFTLGPLLDPDRYEPPIKSVQEFEDYIKNEKARIQSDGLMRQVK